MKYIGSILLTRFNLIFYSGIIYYLIKDIHPINREGIFISTSFKKHVKVCEECHKRDKTLKNHSRCFVIIFK
jgi:hypothetical protein